MAKLYQNTANATTGGTAIGPAGQNIEVSSLIIGNPVASANIYLYDETNVGDVTNTTGRAVFLTLPATLATGQLPFVIDLTDGEGHGVILDSGGSIAIDQALQLTVIYKIAEPGAVQ